MNDKKTERKNKINQVVSWPAHDEYFTIETLKQKNPHMLTSSGSDITLRVRLSDAITKDKTIAVIGTKNLGKGRPRLAFVMTPVNQVALDKAKADDIMLVDESKIVQIMEITPTVISVEVTPVKTHNNVTDVVV